MNIALWIGAGLLAVLYLAAGGMKLAKSKSELQANPNMAWVQDFSQGSVRAIGLAEVLGALGLVLPEATGIAPILTPTAAFGLAALQVGAIITHVRRHETKALPVNVALLVLALFVAIGRIAIG